MKREICFKFQKEFIHCWPQAPVEVDFLQNPHRHLLHIEVHISVSHNQRELEFLLCKKELEAFYNDTWWDISTSCETIAETLIQHLRDVYGVNHRYQVGVFEDGENGAILTSEE